MKYPKFIGSSANPENLSATVQGALIGLIPLVILLSKQKGVELSENELVNMITAIIAGATAVASLVTIVFGLVRKLVLFVQSKLQNKE